MRQEKINVLVVSGGGFQGLTLIKGLRQIDTAKVILLDCYDNNISRYFADKFYVAPMIVNGDDFINYLLTICAKEDIRLIIPSTDHELTILSEHISAFEERDIHVATSTLSLLKTLRNKKSLYAFLDANNLRTLPSLDITKNDLSFPLIGKPLHGWGGRGIIILNSSEDIKKYDMIELEAHYVWQRYLQDFEEFSIDFAIGFSNDISALIIRKRVRTSGGFCIIADAVENEVIEEMTRRFALLISQQGGHGIFNVQILKAGVEYFFSDVNPRVGTSALFSTNNGISLPLFLCLSIKPEIFEKHVFGGHHHGKLRMVRYLEELWIEGDVLNNIKGIVFDLDDTLINHKEWIFSKLEILASQFAGVIPDRERFLSTALWILEEGNRAFLLDALVEELRLDSALSNRLIEAYREIVPTRCALYPDTVTTLEELRRKGCKLALVTDNPPLSQRQKIEANNLEGFFDTIVFSRELGGEKPDKLIFDEVGQRLQLPSRALAMVGDNLYRDVIASIVSGFGAAFLLRREGAFFNFDKVLFARIYDDRHRFETIKSLRDILWYLK